MSGEQGSLFREVAENRVGNQNFDSGRGHAFFCLFPHWNWPWDSFSIPSGVLYSADVSCHGKWSIRYLMLCDHMSSSTVLGGLRLLHFLLNVVERCSHRPTALLILSWWIFNGALIPYIILQKCRCLVQSMAAFHLNTRQCEYRCWNFEGRIKLILRNKI